jgi:phosphomannomutase
MIDSYIDSLAANFDFEAVKRYKILVDCCNGTSSLILRRLKDRYGFRFTLLNERLDGVTFAHDPVISANTIGLQLAPMMEALGADAGFQFDVDSDRVGIATETGTAVSEEMILPLIADWLLPRGQGKIVITNLSSTALIEEVAVRHGGRVVRVPVGRQAAIDALGGYRTEQIAVAGEGTGAVMMPQFEFVYDGIASMFAILSLMNQQGRPLGKILGEYPKYFMLKGDTPLSSPRIPELLMELQHRYSDGTANVTDGLRVDWPHRWFHVRVSQTEPIVRVICEQRDAPPVSLFDELQEAVRSL